MSKAPSGRKAGDMYWFAHGGIETNSDKSPPQQSNAQGDVEDDSSNDSLTWRPLLDYKGHPEEPKPAQQSIPHLTLDLGHNSSTFSSMEKEDRARTCHSDRRTAVEDRRKQLWEAEQERNDALMKKHMERDAALEARRNAQRSNISFAFGSSVPRNLEANQSNQNGEEKVTRFPVVTASSQKSGEDVMTRSMTASMYAPRGRRKNDLTPTVPYERTAPPPRSGATSFTRKRSVSMTRLDQLAQPRKHYVEATKANSTASSGASSMHKDILRSPTRPMSSASEKSGQVGSTQAPSGSVLRRSRTSPRKPRPVTIAGTIPDQRPCFEVKVSPIKRSHTPNKRPTTADNTKKAEATNVRSTKSAAERTKSDPRSTSEKPAPKRPPPKQAAPKKAVVKTASVPKATSTPKVPAAKKSPTNKKKPEVLISVAAVPEAIVKAPVEIAKVTKLASPARSPSPESESNAENDKSNSKRIISEEEAKAALAEKRKLAREQAEKEAELEKQRQEDLRLQEEERLHKEEEEQRLMEVEQLRLIEEHRKQEEEKLRKAIEEQERKEEEEKAKKEEELRMKTEQEKKAKEEAEKQRIELEEKLRKEEEERAERKKRLDKIMSRTRGGKASGTSPSGSISGSDQLDSGENQQEVLSSGANSLDSNEVADLPSDGLALDDHLVKTEPSSPGDSLEANPTYEIESESESLNGNDMMMPSSETASQDNSMIIYPDRTIESTQPISESTIAVTDKLLPQSQAIIEELDGGMIHDSDQQKDMEKHAVFEDKLLIEPKLVDNSVSSIKLGGISESKNISNSKSEYFGNKVDSLPDPMISESSDERIPNADALQYEDNFAHPFESHSMGKSSFFDQAGPEVVEMNTEHSPRDSTSSDIKLPDPIYETTSSDEGSISSEKLQKDMTFEQNEFNNFVFHEGDHTDINMPASDDVFSEQKMTTTVMPELSNPFANEDSQLQTASTAFIPNPIEPAVDLLIQDEASMKENINEPFDINAKTVTNPSTAAEEIVASEVDMAYNKVASFNPFSKSNEEGIVNFSDNSVLDLAASAFDNPSTREHQDEGFNFVSAAVDNIPDNAESRGDISRDHFSSKPVDDINFPKDDRTLSDATEFDEFALKASCDHRIIQNNSSLSEQKSDCENQTVVDHFSKSPTNDVTIITDKDSGDCVGIISSLDQVQEVTTNFSKPGFNKGHLNNFESTGATDSEDNSSLDSNLSQVMTVNTSENDTNDGLSCIETNGSGKYGTDFDTTEQQYLSHVPPFYNGDLNSKTNGTHLASEETVTNGYRNQSSEHAANVIGEFPNHTQLDKVKGNDISSVDHSKDNIFENVDAIDFSKMSPDPFLAKGNSNPISGNPFLM